MDILTSARPEDVGVRPQWVTGYVREMNRRRKMCHSFLMMRRGKVFAEGYWKPFGPETRHRMYSVSKSFVSAAIGLLVDDGMLRLTDRIVDYFPEYLPEELDPKIAATTIRDMLRMAVPHRYPSYRGEDKNWIHTFFQPRETPDLPAGTKFRYDTSATYTLCVLIERLTGKTFLELLQERVLTDIGFSKDARCVCAPEGYAWGGSGVLCTTRDLARFGVLMLREGNLNGKQYLSRDYCRAATSFQIDNREGAVDNIHGHGYGYQFWRFRDGAFGCLGMGGQLVVCVPEKDFLFVCTSDMQGDADGYVPIADVLWQEVIDKLDSEPTPRDDGALAEMNGLLAHLTCNLPAGEPSSPLEQAVDGAVYALEDNPMGIRRLRLRFTPAGGSLWMDTVRGEKVFAFGRGCYWKGTFPETGYSGRAINHPLGRGYRCMHTAVWTSPQTLLIRTYVTDDYFGNLATTLTFDGDRVAVTMEKTAEWFLNEYQGRAKGRKL